MNKKNIITWVLFFLVFFVILQFFNKKQKAPPPDSAKGSLIITPAKTEFASGEEVKVTVKNYTASVITLPSNCPKNPFRVLSFSGEKFEEKGSESKMDCALAPDVTIEPNSEKTVSYTYWNYALFGNPGKYKVEIAFNNGSTTEIVASPEFAVVPAGIFRKLFRTVFFQPIYNTLVMFIRIAPAHDLGLAIILLTILIRIILLIPSQRAIVSQRHMQELQPKLEQIKKKYAGNQERIAQETMRLWKENKVNPFGSCLPLIIQFPVLIALFYVIQNGLNPDNAYLLYSPFKDSDLTAIHTNFLGILDLTKVNMFVLPLIIGALQFFQFKIAVRKKLAKAETEEKKEEKGSEMEMANKTMMYAMPVMIAIFTASVPAGVGLYWGVSTLFAIGQQMIANRSTKSQIPNPK